MNRIKLAIRAEALGLPLRQALAEIERLGVSGIQVDAVGELGPRGLSQTGRRELGQRLRSHNLTFSALGCPLRHGLGVVEGQDARIEHVKRVLTLSYDLGPRVVVVAAGALPEDPASPAAAALDEALLALGQHGDRTGTVLALETGLESGAALAGYLARLDTGGLGVCYDPANLLIAGFDPYESARALAGRVVYAQARDARPSGANRTAQEVALGHGQLDFMLLAGMFEEIDYHGWLAIRRDGGDQRLADVRSGVAFLRRLFFPPV
jgi:sugar phosphate isomerase/epimerase